MGHYSPVIKWMQSWGGWRYKSENKARRCVVTVVTLVIVATSQMNHQMQPNISGRQMRMTILMVLAVAGCGCVPWACSLALVLITLSDRLCRARLHLFCLWLSGLVSAICWYYIILRWKLNNNISPPSLLPLPGDRHSPPPCEKISETLCGLIV